MFQTHLISHIWRGQFADTDLTSVISVAGPRESIPPSDQGENSQFELPHLPASGAASRPSTPKLIPSPRLIKVSSSIERNLRNQLRHPASYPISSKHNLVSARAMTRADFFRKMLSLRQACSELLYKNARTRDQSL